MDSFLPICLPANLPVFLPASPCLLLCPSTCLPASPPASLPDCLNAHQLVHFACPVLSWLSAYLLAVCLLARLFAWMLVRLLASPPACLAVSLLDCLPFVLLPCVLSVYTCLEATPVSVLSLKWQRRSCLDGICYCHSLPRCVMIQWFLFTC